MDETARQILYVGVGLFVSGFLLLINHLLKKNAKHDETLYTAIELMKEKIIAIEKQQVLINITLQSLESLSLSLDFMRPAISKATKDINEAYVLIRGITKTAEILRERSHWVNNELTKLQLYLPLYRPSDFPIIKE